MLAPGEKFRIVRVDPGMDGILAYLDDLNLGIDSTGEVVSQSLIGETMSLQMHDDQGGKEVVIGLKVAERLFVLTDSKP
jgi:hypothetical protein